MQAGARARRRRRREGAAGPGSAARRPLEPLIRRAQRLHYALVCHGVRIGARRQPGGLNVRLCAHHGTRDASACLALTLKTTTANASLGRRLDAARAVFATARSCKPAPAAQRRPRPPLRDGTGGTKGQARARRHGRAFATSCTQVSSPKFSRMKDSTLRLIQPIISATAHPNTRTRAESLAPSGRRGEPTLHEPPPTGTPLVRKPAAQARGTGAESTRATSSSV